MKKSLTILSLFILTVALSKTTYAHCEVPCGIYQDELRVELIKEHMLTIKKAMTKIAELQAADTINYNQLVRWINTKEHHANLIQEIAEQYFLTQRVKFADPEDEDNHKKYVAQLTSLHQLIVYSMKSKQSIDLDIIPKMVDALAAFEMAYFAEKRYKIDESQGESHKKTHN